MLVLVSDNAGNNSTLLDALIRNCASELTDHFTSATNWIRCFAHILNLGAQATLSVLKGNPGSHADSFQSAPYTLDGQDTPEVLLKTLSVYDRVNVSG
jgi:hypothetical protein